MSRITSKWTSPELRVHNYLKGHKIRHQMHPALPGKPDVLLTDCNTVIFIHGCFWHGCKQCYIPPKSNKLYWGDKLLRNMARDRAVKKALRGQGYSVKVFWEHELENLTVLFSKVLDGAL